MVVDAVLVGTGVNELFGSVPVGDAKDVDDEGTGSDAEDAGNELESPGADAGSDAVANAEDNAQDFAWADLWPLGRPLSGWRSAPSNPEVSKVFLY